MRREIIDIIGCGGHARSVYNTIIDKEMVREFVDVNAKPNEKIFGVPVNRKCIDDNVSFIIALGDNVSRKKFYLEHLKYNYISVVAESAIVGKDFIIDNGVFIAHLAYVGPQCSIGKHTIINTASVLEHECTIGSFSHLAPHSTVCGRCIIGSNVFIGAGATVIDKINICDNVIVGAGATVITDINEEGIYCGTPARKIGKIV